MVSEYIILIIVVIVLYMSIKNVKESEVYVIERLGKFHKIVTKGLIIMIPFVDKVKAIVNLKEMKFDIMPQHNITKDKKIITVSIEIMYQIIDPQKAVYEVQNLRQSIEYLSVLTIKNIISKIDYDNLGNSQNAIHDEFNAQVNKEADKWGCKINRTEFLYNTVKEDK